jgi:hypothetical protein
VFGKELHWPFDVMGFLEHVARQGHLHHLVWLVRHCIKTTPSRGPEVVGAGVLLYDVDLAPLWVLGPFVGFGRHTGVI